jgi:hypothetical protein
VTDDQLIEVLKVALPAIGALVAGWLGTRLGLRKLRHERAFDARVEWHRKLAETAVTLRNRIRTLASYEQGSPALEAAMPLLTEMAGLAYRFQELAEQASMYATPKTHARSGGRASRYDRGSATVLASRPPRRGDA